MDDVKPRSILAQSALTATRSQRKRRYVQIQDEQQLIYGRTDSDDEQLQLDLTRDPADNLKEMLINITKVHGVRNTLKLAHLNNFVRLCCHLGNQYAGYSREDVLCCLRLGLLHQSKEVRTATLRAIRYYIRDKHRLETLLRLKVDLLVARCLDIVLDNEMERIQILRLIRKMISIDPSLFPQSLLNPVVAIANDGANQHDRLVKCCLSIICELAIYNPELVARVGGIGAIMRNVLDFSACQVNESMMSTVLYLFNHPRTRQLIRHNVDIEQILAPFTDCHYKHCGEASEQSLPANEKELRFNASKQAIIAALRSWPGMIRLCQPNSTGISSVINILYLPYADIRKHFMEMVFELFNLPKPEMSNNFSKVLASLDLASFGEKWQLTDGFVVEEAMSLLPHRATTRVNLMENYFALLISAFVQAGLFEALVEIITTSEDCVSIQGTVLLGQLLYLGNRLVPLEISPYSQCLPTLAALATTPNTSPAVRIRAREAVSYLNQLHQLRKRDSVPCSLFLDQILKLGRRGTLSALDSSNRVEHNSLISRLKESEEALSLALKDSQVLVTKDNLNWDWDAIAALLKWPGDALVTLDKSANNNRFMTRVTYFYRPSSRLYCEMKQNEERTTMFTTCGCYLIDFLLEHEEPEYQKLLDEFLSEIADSIKEIAKERVPGNLTLSPQSLLTTLSQNYFLFIGRISYCKTQYASRGEATLQKAGVFQSLLDLVSITTNDTYIKLIVTSLNYCRQGAARTILKKILTAGIESSRMYATHHLRVLLRAQVDKFHSWAMELLVQQLYDKSKQVALAALDVIDEACEDVENLKAMVRMKPSLLHLGDKGNMMMVRFLSIPAGFKYLSETQFAGHELSKWNKMFNIRYVSLIEQFLNEALTSHRVSEDGGFIRRTNLKQNLKDVFVPVHLYGQLAQHREGFDMLTSQDHIKTLSQLIRSRRMDSEQEVIELKSAVWALGHLGATQLGVELLYEMDIIPDIIKLAEESSVYSVRGSCFYVLGLLGSTRIGVEVLQQLGWESVTHTRHDIWPVIEEHDFSELEFSNCRNSMVDSFSSVGSEKTDLSNPPSDPIKPIDHQTVAKLKKNTLVLDIPHENDDRLFYIGSNNPSPCKEGIEASPKTSPLKDEVEYFIDEDIPQHMELKRISEKQHPLPLTNLQTNTPILDDRVCALKRAQTLPQRKISAPASVKFLPQCDGTEEDILKRNRFDTGVELSPPVVRSTKTRRVGRIHSPSEVKSFFTNKPVQLSLAGGEVVKPTAQLLTVKPRSGSFKDERSDSNESQRTKSRSDSCNESTSGFSSCESNPRLYNEPALLSPIASISSINTLDGRTVHHSESARRKLDLKRIPSVQRQLSQPTGAALAEHGDLSVVFTSSRDAQGFATLRNLQRSRSTSQNSELTPPPDHEVFADLLFSKFNGLDISSGGFRKSSFSSLPEKKVSILQSPSRSTIRSLTDSQTGPQYAGLVLPVDVGMIFHDENGDVQISSSASVISDADEKFLDFGPVVDNLQSPTSVPVEDDGLENHDPDTCLGCLRIYRRRGGSLVARDSFVIGKVGAEEAEFLNLTIVPPDDESAETKTPDVKASTDKNLLSTDSARIVQVSEGGKRSRVPSAERATPHSCTSVDSTDSVKKWSTDSLEGKIALRKEVMHLIVNLSSSVAVKSTEQGLLNLKQHFTKAFLDTCLYSSMAHLLATYKFRLTARRFLQELFQDAPMSELYTDPQSLLGIEDEVFSTLGEESSA